MHNWNTNTSNWNKKSDSFKIWQLNQTINFGLNKTKLNLPEVRKYWKKLDLDPYRKKFLEFILWPNQF